MAKKSSNLTLQGPALRGNPHRAIKAATGAMKEKTERVQRHVPAALQDRARSVAEHR